ncbi:DNA/RNA non-specific endonuclease [Flavobacteriaceae bacterium]|nr:DNA/RNA non-specific endonuclease [Flavobacteriaceae bacterium]
MRTFIFLLLIPIISFGQENYKLYVDYLPSSKCGEVIHYNYYSVSYCDENKISEWSIHNVSKESLRGITPRQKYYTLDDKGRGATSDDYRHSGYDRGHLVPAANMKLNETSSREVSYMTNMTPQQPAFNRGIWLFLESKLREKTQQWGNDKANLNIISGQFGKTSEIGKNKIPVPEYFYKIAFDITENRAIAFLIPNKKGYETNLENYAVSISYLEELTGIDFFYKLDSFTQFQLEKLETKLVKQKTYTRVLSDDKKESKVVTINNYNKKGIHHYLKNVEIDPKKSNSIYSKAVNYSNIKSRGFLVKKKMDYNKLNNYVDSQSHTNSKN